MSSPIAANDVGPSSGTLSFSTLSISKTSFSILACSDLRRVMEGGAGILVLVAARGDLNAAGIGFRRREASLRMALAGWRV